MSVVAGRIPDNLPGRTESGPESRRAAGSATASSVNGCEHDLVAGGQAQLLGRRATVDARAPASRGVDDEPDSAGRRRSPNVSASVATRTSIADADADRARPNHRSRRAPTLSWQLPKWSTHSTSPTSASPLDARQRDDAGQQRVGVDRVAELGEVDAVAQVGRRRGRRCRGRRTSRRAPRGGSRRWSARPPARRRRPSPRPERAVRCRDRRARRRRRRPRSRRPGVPCPTPGSTTASTTPVGRYEIDRASARLPARTSNGAMPWVRSMTVACARDVADHRLHDADELVGRARSR